MRKFDLSLRSSRSSYFATFRHQLTILSKTDALDEEKWLNMLGTFGKVWFRYESHFVHGRDFLVYIFKERRFFFPTRRSSDLGQQHDPNRVLVAHHRDGDRHQQTVVDGPANVRRRLVALVGEIGRAHV